MTEMHAAKLVLYDTDGIVHLFECGRVDYKLSYEYVPGATHVLSEHPRMVGTSDDVIASATVTLTLPEPDLHSELPGVEDTVPLWYEMRFGLTTAELAERLGLGPPPPHVWKEE